MLAFSCTRSSSSSSIVLSFISTENMVLTDYAKLKILSLWRHGDGPTLIVKKLQDDGIITTRKTVSLLISRYAPL